MTIIGLICLAALYAFTRVEEIKHVRACEEAEVTDWNAYYEKL